MKKITKNKEKKKNILDIKNLDKKESSFQNRFQKPTGYCQ